MTNVFATHIYLKMFTLLTSFDFCPSSSDSVLIQKRLKKEKRSKRRLQEALEEEVKLRDQAEHSLLHTANTHTGTPPDRWTHTFKELLKKYFTILNNFL